MASVDGLDVVSAVIRPGREEFALEHLVLSDLAPEDILVHITGVGMCHTDLAAAGPQGAPFHPAVFGHEGAGVVAATGSAVTSLTKGDHVVLSYDSCGHCQRCHQGTAYFCDTWEDLNTGPAITREHASLSDSSGSPVHGSWFGQSSFATYAVATQRNAVKVADHLPLEILGPLGCGFMTGAGSVLNAFSVRPGESIAIFGAGAVGLAAVMAARICGAETIIAIDPVKARRDLAEHLGATHVLDGQPDTVTAIRRITGSGLDYSFDTSGRADVVATAVHALRSGGTCGMVAMVEDLRLDSPQLVLGRTVTGTILGHAQPQVVVPQLISWWESGLFPFDTLIQSFDLKDINDAAQASRSGAVVKPVLIP